MQRGEKEKAIRVHHGVGMSQLQNGRLTAEAGDEHGWADGAEIGREACFPLVDGAAQAVGGADALVLGDGFDGVDFAGDLVRDAGDSESMLAEGPEESGRRRRTWHER
jgi:hypothetical protein